MISITFNLKFEKKHGSQTESPNVLTYIFCQLVLIGYVSGRAAQKINSFLACFKASNIQEIPTQLLAHCMKHKK